jgi:hypothetical protein
VAVLRETVEAKDAQLAAAEARIAVLGARVADLERALARDSSTSSLTGSGWRSGTCRTGSSMS